MKQPTKSTRPPILLDKLTRHDETANKPTDKDKNKQIASNPTHHPD